MSDAIFSGPGTSSASESFAWLSGYPEHIDWQTDFRPRPLFELLDAAASRYPSQNCTNFLGRITTYRDIAQAVDHAACGLEKLGVNKGTRVGLFFPNCPNHIVFYFAILKLGGTVVNYNPLYSLDELEYQIGDSDTQIMLTLDLQLLFGKIEQLMMKDVLKRAVICDFAAQLPHLKSLLFRLFKSKERAKIDASPVRDRLSLEADVLSNDGRYTKAAIDPTHDLAVLQYTGGTTGTPKGAMLTHANLYVNVLQVVNWAPDLEDCAERMMGVLPFFHVFAMTVVMNFAIAKAAEIVLVPKFELDDTLKTIAATKPTCMPGVPTLYTAMINHPRLSQFDLSSLKFCLSGGAPLPLEVKNEFEKLTGCNLVEGYGLSETSPVVTANPIGGSSKENSIGVPLQGTILSLRNLQDPGKEVALGERGEICIKGPQVMAGYWNKPEETEAVFAGDFLRTGDVGVMDDQGFTTIVDRIKDIILCSGYNVYPRRIEDALYEHEAVEEVTVIGVPDDYRGEAPKAFIKLRKGHDVNMETILTFLEDKLSKIEMPEHIEFRDELPKTMVGKLSKKELREEESSA